MKGWGPKSSVCPSKPRESNFFGGISRDFAGTSRKRPKSLRKKCLGSILVPYSRAKQKHINIKKRLEHPPFRTPPSLCGGPCFWKIKEKGPPTSRIYWLVLVKWARLRDGGLQEIREISDPEKGTFFLRFSADLCKSRCSWHPRGKGQKKAEKGQILAGFRRFPAEARPDTP